MANGSLDLAQPLARRGGQLVGAGLAGAADGGAREGFGRRLARSLAETSAYHLNDAQGLWG